MPRLKNLLNIRIRESSLLIFAILFIFSFIHKINLIYNYDINIDETYALADVTDFTYDARSPGYDIDKHEVASLIRYYRKSTDQGGLIARVENLRLLFSRWHTINVHPPLTTALIKIMTPAKRDLITLRWWALIMFCVTLFTLYCFFRSLGFEREETLISLAIFSSTCLGSLYAIFPRPYTPALILLALIWLCFHKLQSKPTLSLLFINLILCYLCFMTHLFAWITAIISMLALSIFYFDRNKPKAILINLIQIIISCSYYYLHYNQIQIQKSIYPRQFLGHHGLGEFTDAALAFYNLMTMNFLPKYAWLLAVFFVIFAYVNRKEFFQDRKNWLLWIFTLAPFVAVIIADYYANKYAATRIRYFLFALPFISLLLTRLFKNQKFIFTLVMVPVIFINYSSPQLHQLKTINHFLWDEYQTKLDYLVHNKLLFKEPLMFLLPNLDNKGILFIHKYLCSTLEIDQLKGPDIDDLNTRSLIEDYYIISPYVSSDKIKKIIDEKKITKIITLVKSQGLETLGSENNPVTVI